MPLEFGLIMAGLGVLSVFSALAVIAVTCEVLKRSFKGVESEITPLETPVKETTLKREALSEEEEAAVTAAILAYVGEAPHATEQITTFKKGVQPLIWSLTGRKELMDLRVRRENENGKKI